MPLRRFIFSIAAGCLMSSLLGISAVAGYGGGAGHEMWQVGLSFNCNNPDFCGSSSLGGYWGWAEFDRDGATTWGDFRGSFCMHSVAHTGFSGAGSITIEADSWTVGPFGTFLVTGTEVDTFRGQRTTTPLVDDDSGIPAAPGHYETTQIFGSPVPPGVTVQIQVSYRPARGN